jgi:PKHD-type hydroxylase
MNQIWQYWQASLNDELVNNIISLGEQYPESNPGLGFDGSTNNDSHRSSEIHWINPNDYPSKFLVDILWYYAREANRNAFGFAIDYLPDIQYTKYHASDNGKYDWHHDTFWANPTTYDRKLSIVIQLSDPSDYTGGDFEIDSQYPQLPADIIKEKGTVIVFPSFINHRVTPVTSGTRKSLVSWIQGPKFR